MHYIENQSNRNICCQTWEKDIFRYYFYDQILIRFSINNKEYENDNVLYSKGYYYVSKTFNSYLKLFEK